MLDLSTWSRADVMSAVSLFISGIALLFSAIAAGAAVWQARVAADVREDAADAELPAGRFMFVGPSNVWPNVFAVNFEVTNMSSRPMELRRVGSIRTGWLILANSEVLLPSTGEHLDGNTVYVDDEPRGRKWINFHRPLIAHGLKRGLDSDTIDVALYAVPAPGLLARLRRRIGNRSLRLTLLIKKDTERRLITKHLVTPPFLALSEDRGSR